MRVVAVNTRARCGRRPTVALRSSRAWGVGTAHADGRRRGQTTAALKSEDGATTSTLSPSRLLIIECDGVLVDIHKEIHLAAFNAAFRELGLDCANWTPAIYTDLIRMGDGTVRGKRDAKPRHAVHVLLPEAEEARALLAPK